MKRILIDLKNHGTHKEKVEEKDPNIQQPVVFFERKIPSDICDSITNEFDNKNLVSGSLSKTNIIDYDIRNVLLKSINQTHWVNSFLYYFGSLANDSNFEYKIDRLNQVDFLKYTKGMFYKPHIDTSPDKSCLTHKRKLTVIVQLSDENDYTDGEIEFYINGPETFTVPKTKGTIIIFPSNLPHQVKEITSGVRYSLVGWIIGPPFA